MSKFFRWGSFSLPGHIALFEIFLGMPLFLTFSWLNYSEGTLTAGWAVYVAFICSVAGFVSAVLIWYAISLPLIKSRGGR